MNARGGHVTDEWLAESIRRTRAEQGLPPKVTDPVALDAIATHVRPWLDDRQDKPPAEKRGAA